MLLDVVDTLRELVRIPSVNPMGRAQLGGDIYHEHRVTDYLQGLFTALGLPWERLEVHPGRDNIVARLEGATPPEQGGPLLLFEAHQDTVPIDGMTIDPFGGEVRDGRLWGRGACDIKGGLAAMLAAVARAQASGERPPATVVLACTVNEEHGFTGASALCAAWQGGSRLLPRRPDAAIVAEPTSLQAVVAHKGVVRWKCRTHGRAAHSSQPDKGENAIFKMARVLDVLERCQREFVPGEAEHRLVGRPSLSVGVIQGGLSVNTVPDLCTIDIDRRLAPGEDPLVAWRRVIDYVEQAAPGLAEHLEPYIVTRGLADGPNLPLAERVATAAAACGVVSGPIGVQYGTDAAAFSAAGCPSVVFGPGHIDQAHTIDEWLEVEQLRLAADIYHAIIRGGLG